MQAVPVPIPRLACIYKFIVNILVLLPPSYFGFPISFCFLEASMAEGGEQVPPLGDAEPPHHPPTPPISARVRNLFTGRNRNRSRSRDNPDRIDRADSESQAGNEDEEEDENEGEWSVEDLLYRDFMESDPMCKVMLDIAKDNMALLKKAGIKESHVNPLVTRRHICASKKGKIPVQLFLYQY